MNWLDIVLLVLFGLAAFQGLKLGLFGTGVTALGALIGWQLAGQLSDDVGRLFGDSLSNQTVVTVISYAIVVGLTIAAVNFIWKIAKPLLIMIPVLPIFDKLGGVALGLLVGVALCGMVIILLARFAYDFEVPEEGVAGGIAGRVPNVENTRSSVEDALTDSSFVPVFIDVTDSIPGGAFGFVPPAFRASFDILDQRIEEKEAS